MHNPRDIELGQLAIRYGLLTEDQAFECLQLAQRQGVSLADAAVSAGMLSPAQAQTLAQSPPDLADGKATVLMDRAVPPPPSLMTAPVSENDRLTEPLSRQALAERLAGGPPSPAPLPRPTPPQPVLTPIPTPPPTPIPTPPPTPTPPAPPTPSPAELERQAKAQRQLEQLDGAFQAVPKAAESAPPLRPLSGVTGAARALSAASELFDMARYRLEADPRQGDNAALDVRTQRPVTLVLPSGPRGDAFYRAARIMAQLDHPTVPKVHDMGLLQGNPYYTTDRLIGRNLKSILEDPKFVRQVPRLLRDVLAVTAGIVHAHDRGIVHGHLNPYDIVVGTFGEVWITGWGQARALPTASEKVREVAAAPRPPEARSIDSPSAPELKGDAQEAGRAVDVWGLGMILHLGLCKTYPRVTGGSVRDELDKVRLFGKPLPPAVVAITRKALSYDARLRYARADDLRDDLRRYLDGRAVGAYEDSLWEALRRVTRRRPALASLTAGLGLVVIGAGALISWQAWSAGESARARSAQAAAARSAAQERTREAVSRRAESLARAAAWASEAGPQRPSRGEADATVARDLSLAPWSRAGRAAGLAAAVEAQRAELAASSSPLASARARWVLAQLLALDGRADATQEATQLLTALANEDDPAAAGYRAAAALEQRLTGLRGEAARSPQALPDLKAALASAEQLTTLGVELPFARARALTGELRLLILDLEPSEFREPQLRGLQDLLAAARLNPWDPRPLILLSQRWRLNGAADLGFAALTADLRRRRALAQSPELVRALASALATCGQPAEARALLEPLFGAERARLATLSASEVAELRMLQSQIGYACGQPAAFAGDLPAATPAGASAWAILRTRNLIHAGRAPEGLAALEAASGGPVDAAALSELEGFLRDPQVAGLVTRQGEVRKRAAFDLVAGWRDELKDASSRAAMSLVILAARLVADARDPRDAAPDPAQQPHPRAQLMASALRFADGATPEAELALWEAWAALELEGGREPFVDERLAELVRAALAVALGGDEGLPELRDAAPPPAWRRPRATEEDADCE